MKCPCCKKFDTSVIDSREKEDSIRRRRLCTSCGYRFTTFERIDHLKLTIVKRDESLEPYQREKIIQGIKLATEKLSITDAQINKIVDTIEYRLLRLGKDTIPSKKIGSLVLSQLRTLDEVAYLRFSSVYNAFSSLASFEKALSQLNQPKKEDYATRTAK